MSLLACILIDFDVSGYNLATRFIEDNVTIAYVTPVWCRYLTNCSRRIDVKTYRKVTKVKHSVVREETRRVIKISNIILLAGCHHSRCNCAVRSSCTGIQKCLFSKHVKIIIS